MKHGDLLNRHRHSKRLRAPAAVLVSNLSIACLPGPSQYWDTLVGGERVWANLKPRPSVGIDAYMDPLVPALVEYRTPQLIEMEERACRGRSNIGGVEQVFQCDRNSVERSAPVASLNFRLSGSCAC